VDVSSFCLSDWTEVYARFAIDIQARRCWHWMQLEPMFILHDISVAVRLKHAGSGSKSSNVCHSTPYLQGRSASIS
jgi:hypothetical protein